MLSGFVTHLAYASKATDEGAHKFLANRSSKLFFIYYLSSFIALSLKLLNHSLDSSSDNRQAVLIQDAIDFIPDLFGVNAWFSAVLLWQDRSGPVAHFLERTIFPTNAPLWYIQALIFCWIAYPGECLDSFVSASFTAIP